MKSIRIPMFLLVLLAAMLMVGCSALEYHFVDVYINDECLPFTLAKAGAIETLWVFPGDQVIFTNTRDKEVVMTFTTGIFEVDEIALKPGKRVILKVISPGLKEGTVTLTTIDGSKCPDGTPKVVVCEGP